MRTYKILKVLYLCLLAAFIVGPIGMAASGIRDAFPMFTWSLYSYSVSHEATWKFWELEIVEIDGELPQQSVMRPMKTPKGFSRTNAFGQAVAGRNSQAARSILKNILMLGGVQEAEKVRVKLHNTKVRPVEYATSGKYVDRKTVELTFERL